MKEGMNNYQVNREYFDALVLHAKQAVDAGAFGEAVDHLATASTFAWENYTGVFLDPKHRGAHRKNFPPCERDVRDRGALHRTGRIPHDEHSHVWRAFEDRLAMDATRSRPPLPVGVDRPARA